jgi:hypothetical protein
MMSCTFVFHVVCSPFSARTQDAIINQKIEAFMSRLSKEVFLGIFKDLGLPPQKKKIRMVLTLQVILSPPKSHCPETATQDMCA